MSDLDSQKAPPSFLADDVPASEVERERRFKETLAMLRALESDKHVATVCEPHMSRYTIEWNGQALPVGTRLYARTQQAEATQQPATCKPDLQVQPEAQAGADDDSSQDAAVWGLIGIVEGCGAKKDSDDNTTWWVLDVNAFYALEEVLRERVSEAMYRESEPKPAEGGAVASDHCRLNGCVHAAHGCPTWKAGTNPFAPAGSGEAVAWIRFLPDDGYEGPLHDRQMDDILRSSGKWTPLYAGAPPASGQGVASEIINEVLRRGEKEGVDAHPRDFHVTITADQYSRLAGGEGDQ